MSILMVTGIEGARNCADVVGTQLGMDVEVPQGARRVERIAPPRVFGCGRGRDFSRVRSGRGGKDLRARRTGYSLQVNFAVSGAARADPRDRARCIAASASRRWLAAPRLRPLKPS